MIKYSQAAYFALTGLILSRWTKPTSSFLAPRLTSQPATSSRYIYAPPGSGYASPDDEKSALPDSYEPMMEFPGTMRPGRTPENMPFHDLPIGDNDPDPVPWPHFQQIEWHHKWAPPHEHPIPMEDYIEMNGRWATPEMEAAMRAGVRRDVRERRQREETASSDRIITDDEDDEADIEDEPISLGDGIFGTLGSDADRALTAAATSPDRIDDDDEDEEDFMTDDGLDDFLLDLGLDAELEEDVPRSTAEKSVPVDDTTVVLSDDDDLDDDAEEAVLSSNGPTSISVDDDDDLDLSLADEEDLDDDLEIPLEDDLGSDTLDGEDIFDEGGFDFDDGDAGGEGIGDW